MVAKVQIPNAQAPTGPESFQVSSCEASNRRCYLPVPVAAVALVDEAVGDDGGTAAGMGKRGGIIGWSDGGWLAIVSRVVVGRWALGRLVGRLNGWLAGGLISGG